MKIGNQTHFYKNENIDLHMQQNNMRKSVQLKDYSQVLTAVHKGTLTVDGVTLELSDEVRNAIKAADEQRFKDAEKLNEYNAAVHNMHVAEQQGDALKGQMEMQARALEIARRISKGGKVPIQDEQLLMEYSDELYKMAKQAAMMAKEHEEYESLIEEEEEPKEYDVKEGQIDAKYEVQVDVVMGETPVVEGVSEVTVDNPTI